MLIINYFGQEALILDDPTAIKNHFFLLVPMVGLATAATEIASQALIFGAASMTSQAMQLGHLVLPSPVPQGFPLVTSGITSD